MSLNKTSVQLKIYFKYLTKILLFDYVHGNLLKRH